MHNCADGRSAGPLPLRPPLRWRESGGTPDPCLRRVQSRVVVSRGAGEVVAAASSWNNGARARTPPRRGLWRSRRAAGGWDSRIRRSGEVCCSLRARWCGDGVLRVELLPSGLLFVVAGCALALRRRIGRWCGLAVAACTGAFAAIWFRLVLHGGDRRCRVQPVAVGSWWSSSLVAPAGRGGEGSELLEAGSAGGWSGRCRVGGKIGGAEEMVLAVCVHRSGSRRVAAGGSAAYYMCGGALFSGFGGTATPAVARFWGARWWFRLCFLQLAQGALCFLLL